VEPPRRYALVWARAPGAEVCPDSAALERALGALLGRVWFSSPEDAKLVIEGVVQRNHGFHAVLTLRSANHDVLGERKLDSDDPTCDELGRSVALVAAVMIDPDSLTREQAGATPEPAPAPDPAPKIDAQPVAPVVAPIPEPHPTAESPKTTSKEEERSTVLSPVVAFGTGALPTIGSGLGLDVWYTAHQFATFGIGARYWSRQTVDVAGTSAGAEFQLVDAVLSFCPLRIGKDSVRVFFCTAMDFGLLSGTGFGGDYRSVARRPFISPGVEVHAAYDLWSHWQLSATGALEAPLERNQFDYQSVRSQITLFRPSAVTSRLEFGIGYAW
jgi:hypothetical protein